MLYNLYLALPVKHEPILLICPEADSSIELLWMIHYIVHFQAQVTFTSEMSLAHKLTHNANTHKHVLIQETSYMVEISRVGNHKKFTDSEYTERFWFIASFESSSWTNGG